MEDDASLPLHIQFPPVPFLDWHAATDLVARCAPDHEVAAWHRLSSIYRDENAAKAFMDAVKADENTVPVRAAHSTSSLLQGDLDLMTQCEFAFRTTMDPNTVPLPIKLFSVIEERPKPPTERRRLIGWTKSSNPLERRIYEEVISPLAVPFASAASTRKAATFRFAAQADFKKYFQQFELIAWRSFCFIHDDVVYRLASIPTGAVSPPVIAEILTRAVAAWAIRSTGSALVVFADTMIDNVRFYGDSLEALQVVWNEFIAICAKINITIGDQMEPTANTPPYVFMGVEFNHHAHTVALTPKTLAKLEQAKSFLESCLSSDALVRDVASAFGITLTAAQTLNTPLHDKYLIFKFIKRLARSLTQDGYSSQRCQVWKSIIQPWCSWLQFMIGHPSASVRNVDAQSCVTYSDASNEGWGFIIFWPDGHVTSQGARWSSDHRQLHINVKELKAAKFALLRVSEAAVRLRIDMKIDNTTTISWLKKRRADNLSANADVGQTLAAPNVEISSVTYCRSEDNLADKLSRQP